MLASAPSIKEGEMTDYLLLYSGGKMPETEAEQADVMKAWDVWMTSIGPALKDGGNPFTPQAKTIDPMGKVTDGPAGSPASGYSIIQASSLDDAVKLAKDCPVLQGGAKISVYDTFEVMEPSSHSSDFWGSSAVHRMPTNAERLFASIAESELSMPGVTAGTGFGRSVWIRISGKSVEDAHSFVAANASAVSPRSGRRPTSTRPKVLPEADRPVLVQRPIGVV